MVTAIRIQDHTVAALPGPPSGWRTDSGLEQGNHRLQRQSAIHHQCVVLEHIRLHEHVTGAHTNEDDHIVVPAPANPTITESGAAQTTEAEQAEIKAQRMGQKDHRTAIF